MRAKSVTEGDLNTTEAEFIRHHKLSVGEIVDVTEVVPSDMEKAVKAKHVRLFIDGVHCNMGHRLKMRSGRCAICNPKHFAFEGRQRNAARIDRERGANCTVMTRVFQIKHEVANA